MANVAAPSQIFPDTKVEAEGDGSSQGRSRARHLFVCCHGRSSGKPACGPRGGDALLAAVQRELITRRATATLITACGCLGPCFDGPNAVIYPDGAWYAGLSPSDAPALVEHLLGGPPLTAKLSARPGSGDSDAECDSGSDSDTDVTAKNPG